MNPLTVGLPQPPQGGALKLLRSIPIPVAVAQLDFTGMARGYDYLISLWGLKPAADADAYLRVSTDGGATFLSGGTDYSYQGAYTTGTSSAGGTLSTGAGQILLSMNSDAVESSTNSGLTGDFLIHNPSDTTQNKIITGSYYYTGATAGTLYCPTIIGFYKGSTAAIQAVRFLFNGQNIAAGGRALVYSRQTL